MSRNLAPDEIEEIARRIDDRAAGGRIVRLLPATARLAAFGLRLAARPPARDEIVRVICGTKRCDLRKNCYPCIGKANEILRLWDGP